MIIEEEVYLSHHGVKGQKWGIRNKVAKGGKAVGRGVSKTGGKLLDELDIPGRPNRRSNRLSPAQLAKENSKRAKAGKIFAASLLLGYGGYKLSRIISSNRANAASAKASQAFVAKVISDGKKMKLPSHVVSTTNPTTLAGVKSALKDPNHVWKL